MIRLRLEVVKPVIGALVATIIGVVAAADWVSWPQVGRWLWPHIGLVVAFGVAGAFVATAVTRAVQRPAARRDGRVLRWWVVLAAAAVVVGIAWVATKWLLHEADQAHDPAAARVEAIKTGLSIGAGAGGVFALLLAVRRQWHQEISASATELDAAEKRITELYTKAADQLGSDRAPVRLAGIYALERVAQNNPDQRQTIVNVLCAYLRMPYEPPGDSPTDDVDETIAAAHRERVQEREVRLAAQQVIANHLRPSLESGRPVETFWAGIDLDLKSATLIDLDFNGCHPQNVRFDSATFIGGADFSEALITGQSRFNGAQFHGIAQFRNAYFIAASEFRKVRFFHNSWFDGVTFFDTVAFIETQFDKIGSLREAEFKDQAWFDESRFAGDAEFRGTQFNDVSFFQVRFIGTAEFRQARFTGWARFNQAQFSNTVWLKEVEFCTTADFRNALFDGNARFDGAQFGWNVRLDQAAFSQKVAFTDATFASPSPPPHTATLIRSIWGTTFSQAEPAELKEFTRSDVG